MSKKKDIKRKKTKKRNEKEEVRQTKNEISP